MDIITINPQTKWTLLHDELGVIINANDIFDIEACCIEHSLRTIKFPSTMNRLSDDEYLELMKIQGFKIRINKG